MLIQQIAVFCRRVLEFITPYVFQNCSFMWWKSRCKDEWLRTYQINIYDGESWKDEIQKEQQMLLTYIFSQLNVHFQWLALTLKLLYNLLLNLSFQTSKPVCETLFLCQNILRFCEIFMFLYIVLLYMVD